MYYSESTLETYLNGGGLPIPLIIIAKGGFFYVVNAPGE